MLISSWGTSSLTSPRTKPASSFMNESRLMKSSAISICSSGRPLLYRYRLVSLLITKVSRIWWVRLQSLTIRLFSSPTQQSRQSPFQAGHWQMFKLITSSRCRFSSGQQQAGLSRYTVMQISSLRQSSSISQSWLPSTRQQRRWMIRASSSQWLPSEQYSLLISLILKYSRSTWSLRFTFSTSSSSNRLLRMLRVQSTSLSSCSRSHPLLLHSACRTAVRAFSWRRLSLSTQPPSRQQYQRATSCRVWSSPALAFFISTSAPSSTGSRESVMTRLTSYLLSVLTSSRLRMCTTLHHCTAVSPTILLQKTSICLTNTLALLLKLSENTSYRSKQDSGSCWTSCQTLACSSSSWEGVGGGAWSSCCLMELKQLWRYSLRSLFWKASFLRWKDGRGWETCIQLQLASQWSSITFALLDCLCYFFHRLLELVVQEDPALSEVLVVGDVLPGQTLAALQHLQAVHVLALAYPHHCSHFLALHLEEAHLPQSTPTVLPSWFLTGACPPQKWVAVWQNTTEKMRKQQLEGQGQGPQWERYPLRKRSTPSRHLMQKWVLTRGHLLGSHSSAYSVKTAAISYSSKRLWSFFSLTIIIPGGSPQRAQLAHNSSPSKQHRLHQICHILLMWGNNAQPYWSEHFGGQGGIRAEYAHPNYSLVALRGKAGALLDQLQCLFIDVTTGEFHESPRFGGDGGNGFLYQAPQGQWIDCIRMGSGQFIGSIEVETNQGDRSGKKGRKFNPRELNAKGKRICGVRWGAGSYVDFLEFMITQ